MTKYEQFQYYAKRVFEWADMSDETQNIPANVKDITTDSLKVITDQINKTPLWSWSFILRPWTPIVLLYFCWQANKSADQLRNILPKMNMAPAQSKGKEEEGEQIRSDASHQQILANIADASQTAHGNEAQSNEENILGILPVEIWVKNLLPKLWPHETNNLILAGDKELNSEVLQPELNKIKDATIVLRMMQQNQFDEVEALIKENPQILLQYGENPITGQRMTLLQWTYWQHDTHARNMLLSYWPEDQIEARKKQARKFRDHMQSLDHSILTGDNGVYSTYINQLDELWVQRNWNEFGRLEYAIARALRPWSHVIAELMRNDRHMRPNGQLPQFNEDTLPRECAYVDTGMKVFPLLDNKGLGFDLKLFRAGGRGGANVDAQSAYLGDGSAVGWRRVAHVDLAGIRELFQVREAETNAHIDSLLNPKNDNTNEVDNAPVAPNNALNRAMG